MIIKPEDRPTRVLGIDPGNSKTGVAVLEYSPSDNTTTTLYAATVKPDKHPPFTFTEEIMGERYYRQLSIGQKIVDTIRKYNPCIIGYENPFVGIRPSAYGPLVELRTVIRQILLANCSTIPVFYYSPTHVKSVMGVKDFKEKDSVKEALSRSNVITSDVMFEECGPDGRDAIAIAATTLVKLNRDDFDLLI